MKYEVIELTVNVNDIITPISCAKMIIELIKLIVYQKELIPYPYEVLKLCINKQKELESSIDKKNANQIILIPHIPFQFHKCFKMAQEACDSLENVFTQITELVDNSDNRIDEIIIILGSSLAFPENVFHIHIPRLDLVHLSKYHSLRKNNECLFRSVFTSDKFHDLISHNKCKSNLYVLFKMDRAFVERPPFFIPRFDFKLPTRGRHANISFSSLLKNHECLCSAFVIYHDKNISSTINNCPSDVSLSSSMAESDHEVLHDACLNSDDSFNDQSESTWYQLKNPIKSFTDVKFHGLSLYDVCLNSKKVVS